MAKKVEKIRGAGRYSEAGFWGFIRSGLRAKHSRWPPRFEALANARRPSKDKTNARLRWQFKCAKCRKWYAQKLVEVDHIVPCGSLKSYEDLPGFVQRMFVEVDGYRVVCKPCHVTITNEERKKNAKDNDS